MNLELFIARRMLRGKYSGSVSVPIVKIAVTGIAVGIAVMLLSVFIVTGFKQEITNKLSGFMAHLNLSAPQENLSFFAQAVVANDSILLDLNNLDGIKQAYCYVDKPAILKSRNEIHGVVLKGVDSLFDANFFKKHICDGEYPYFGGGRATNDILLSSSVAALLGVKCGDKVSAHFVQEPPRVRVFTVKGVYNTGFKEYDDLTVVCDMRHLQRLNGWDALQVSGIAVELENLKYLEHSMNQVEKYLFVHEIDQAYHLTNLYQIAPQLFDWLDILNVNVVIILVLIVLVAGFNMVSGLLIFILDKTTMIGIMKALGIQNVSLRKLFLYVAVGMIVRGVWVGNLLALGMAALQYFFGIIKLDPTVYYMDTVPISIHWGYFILLNVGVLLVSVLMLVVPTMLISRIRPIKAIRFE